MRLGVQVNEFVVKIKTHFYCFCGLNTHSWLAGFNHSHSRSGSEKKKKKNRKTHNSTLNLIGPQKTLQIVVDDYVESILA